MANTCECRRCGKPVTYATLRDVPHFPFCSERCKLSDLGKWFSAGYVISSRLDETDDEPYTEKEEGLQEC